MIGTMRYSDLEEISFEHIQNENIPTIIDLQNNINIKDNIYT